MSNEMGRAEERRKMPSSGKLEDRSGAREEVPKADDIVPSTEKVIYIYLSLVSRKEQSTIGMKVEI